MPFHALSLATNTEDDEIEQIRDYSR